LGKLIAKLEFQIKKCEAAQVVEIISLIDNKQITIGAKRNRLKNMASGKYFCFVDDDDDVYDEYVEAILNATMNDSDVICFDSWVNIEGENGRISVSADNPENEQFVPDGVTLRKPSHVNAWKTKKFKKYEFSDKMYGEDFDFCYQCYPHIKSETIINVPLHKYTYDSKITQAFEK